MTYPSLWVVEKLTKWARIFVLELRDGTHGEEIAQLLGDEPEWDSKQVWNCDRHEEDERGGTLILTTKTPCGFVIRLCPAFDKKEEDVFVSCATFEVELAGETLIEGVSKNKVPA